MRGAALLLVAALASCSDVSITTVDPAIVEISPPSSFVRMSETRQLNVEVRSRDGELLPGRAISWRSQQPDIAQVDENGLVQGLAPGNATIEATAEGVTGSATVTVTSGPAVQLNADTVEITAVDGGASPGDRTVNVINAGDGTLNGLTAAIEYAPGQPTGWLDADLSGSTAPASLVLSASHAGLAVGTYTALVRVSSSAASNGADSTVVRLVVLTPAPAIALGSNSVSFVAAEQGADPSTQNVAITNAGGGTLNGLTASVSYASGQRTGWLSAQLASTTAPTTLTLRATTSTLAAGTYSATVSIASAVAQNSPRALQVTFTIGPQQPVLNVQPAVLEFGAAQGGGNPAGQTVNITNSGGGTLSGISVSVIYPGGQASGWLNTELSGTTAPATVTVNASTGSLAPGTYNASVRVASNVAANSPQLVDVTFVVQPPPPPAAPTGLTATAASASRIELAWTAAAGFVTQYRIERATGSGGFTQIDQVGGSTLAYSDSGLNDGTRYVYRVRACNPSGCSGYSNEADATTQNDGPFAPPVPTDVDATAISPTQIRITWDSDALLVTGFEVQRAPGSNPTAFVTVANPSGSARSYTDGGLEPATSYIYRVRACNLGVCSDWSRTDSATTASFIPAVPGNVDALGISDDAIRVSWDGSAGATSYGIRRRRGSGNSDWGVIATVPDGTTQYIDEGLQEDTRYHYQVRACAGSSCSDWSSTASAETDDD